MILAYQEVTDPQALTFRFGTHGDGILDPPLGGLQAIAHIARFGPERKDILVADLDCLRTRSPGWRALAKQDFSPETKRLARQCWEGKRLPDHIVIDSFGKLYQRTMTQVMAGLPDDKVAEFGSLLAGEALHQLVFDLEKGGHRVTVVTWVEDGRPYLPHSLDRLVESVQIKESAA